MCQIYCVLILNFSSEAEKCYYRGVYLILLNSKLQHSYVIWHDESFYKVNDKLTCHPIYTIDVQIVLIRS